MSKLESEFQKEVLAFLKESKVFHYRTQMGAQSGLPDIIACINGVFVGIELKRPDGRGKLTLQQQKVLDDIEKAGGITADIMSIKELCILIDMAIYQGQFGADG